MTYCRCGDSMRIDKASPDLVAAAQAAWRTVHNGPGHGECTRDECERARREQRAEERSDHQ